MLKKYKEYILLMVDMDERLAFAALTDGVPSHFYLTDKMYESEKSKLDKNDFHFVYDFDSFVRFKKFSELVSSKLGVDVPKSRFYDFYFCPRKEVDDFMNNSLITITRANLIFEHVHSNGRELNYEENFNNKSHDRYSFIDYFFLSILCIIISLYILKCYNYLNIK